MKSLLFKSIVFAALGGGMIWLCDSTGLPSAASGAGLSLVLPRDVGSWSGTAGEPSEAEKEILPPDTEFAKMHYRNSANPAAISASIVLSGKDRTSIHRPEVCLAGQGWNVRSSRKRTVDLANGKSLGVNCLTITRDLTLENGEQKSAEAYYVYWFVGSRTTTPDNLERIVNTAAENLIRGENPRWAYVSLLSVVPRSLGVGEIDAEETLKGIDRWIETAAPRFQRVYEPVRIF